MAQWTHLGRRTLTGINKPALKSSGYLSQDDATVRLIQIAARHGMAERDCFPGLNTGWAVNNNRPENADRAGLSEAV
jgi:hypothetical protein